jgi:cytochrome c-type biogenesis protein CcmH/NrfG
LISSRQTLVILLVAALGVLLYFSPKLQSETKQETPETSQFAAAFEEAMKSIPSDQKQIFDRLQKGLLKAQAENTEEAWMLTATDFLKGARYIQGDQKVTLYKGAIEGFEKALALNPNNLSAKTNLGAAIVESSSFLGNQPMKGITLLREVVQKDSNNIEANLQLGLFSVTSRQFDKAIERFNKILRIDSTHIDMYVYLGDTYLTMGDKGKAIESYENYKIRVKDTLIIKDIDQYIKKLKQNN